MQNACFPVACLKSMQANDPADTEKGGKLHFKR